MNDRRERTLPEVVSREEWLAERRMLLAQEKELTRRRDTLAAARRRLPAVRMGNDYVFEGPDGACGLADLFDGHRQLIVYHFMFAPEWEQGCPGCTHLADEIGPGFVRHLAESDTAFVFVSRAPLSKLLAYRNDKDWTVPWVSSAGSDFNYDFHVTLDPGKGSVMYNDKTRAEHEAAGIGYYFSGDPPWELPGLSCFLRSEQDVLHTWSTYGRGGEMMGGSHYALDMTVLGRQQDWEDSPEGWPQRPTYG